MNRLCDTSEFASWIPPDVRMRIILSPSVSMKEIRSRRESWTHPLPHRVRAFSSGLSKQFWRGVSNERIAPRRHKSASSVGQTRAARGRRLHSARKINYGHGGELFAGFVALSSLVTFNLLAGINLIPLYSPRRPDPFASNLRGLNHFFLPAPLPILTSAREQAIVLLLSS